MDKVYGALTIVCFFVAVVCLGDVALDNSSISDYVAHQLYGARVDVDGRRSEYIETAAKRLDELGCSESAELVRSGEIGEEIVAFARQELDEKNKLQTIAGFVVLALSAIFAMLGSRGAQARNLQRRADALLAEAEQNGE